MKTHPRVGVFYDAAFAQCYLLDSPWNWQRSNHNVASAGKVSDGGGGGSTKVGALSHSGGTDIEHDHLVVRISEDGPAHGPTQGFQPQ